MSNALNATRQEIQQKIEANGLRLSELTGPDDKRIKKRVLQSLGKLKKQLLDIDTQLGSVSSSSASSSASLISEKNISKDEDTSERNMTNTINSQQNESTISSDTQQAPVWNKKKAKLKLKIVNAEIADLALKKQLKLARKRFNWLSNKGLTPGTSSRVCAQVFKCEHFVSMY